MQKSIQKKKRKSLVARAGAGGTFGACSAALLACMMPSMLVAHVVGGGILGACSDRLLACGVHGALSPPTRLQK